MSFNPYSESDVERYDWRDETPETYPLDRPCEYCGDRIVDHTSSELKSCVLDLEARALGSEVRADEVLNFPYWEQDADALAWWRSQQ